MTSAAALSPLHARLLADGAECTRCPMGKGGQPSRPVGTEWFGGSARPKLAIVGELPGVREVRGGRPFIGKSGKILDQVCAHAGVPRGGLAILNAGACGPVPSHADAMKVATIAACRPRLLSELRRLRPDVVLALGGQALRSLAPQLSSGVTALRGALLEPAEDLWWEEDEGLPALALPLVLGGFR